jgi:hypothetical protein
MSNVIEISYVVFLLNSGLSPNQGHFFTLYEGLPTSLFRESIFSNFVR